MNYKLQKRDMLWIDMWCYNDNIIYELYVIMTLNC